MAKKLAIAWLSLVFISVAALIVHFWPDSRPFTFVVGGLLAAFGTGVAIAELVS